MSKPEYAPMFPIVTAQPCEPFHLGKDATSFTMLDFWQWAFSDCLNNTTRGILAEFVVAKALNIDMSIPRNAWAAFDLQYKGYPLEVKSASYHQRWFQKDLSKISFSVRTTKAWDAQTNVQDSSSKRQAFAYVLCLLAEKDRDKVNPLDLDQWQFWAVATSFFDQRERSQHSITYNSLCREVGQPIRFNQIRSAIDEMIRREIAVTPPVN